MSYDPEKSWNNLLLLPPSICLESRFILKACIEARLKLQEMKILVSDLPNQDILLQNLPLQEALQSSAIENITTVNDKLYQPIDFNEDLDDPAAKEILRYREALLSGVTYLNERGILNIPLFEQICSDIRNKSVKIRKTGGISVKNSIRGEVIYTPPDNYQVILNLLTNLESFINDDLDSIKEIDPLIKMAIMHYQFVAIHPFTDGNGRTGRILNILYLISQNLLDLPILYLSRFFLRDSDRYYNYLREITEEGKWEQWILYILEAVTDTSQDVINKTGQISSLMNQTLEKIKNETGLRSAERITNLLFKWPYCKIISAMEELKCSRDTAANYLNKLVEISVLEQKKKGSQKFYINRSLINLLSN